MSAKNRAIVRYDTNDGQSGDHSHNATNSSANRRRADEELTQQQMDRIVCDGIKYLLVLDHKKLPIKRSDLFKAILKNTTTRKTQELIFTKITQSLSQSFAIELSECPENNNCFILVNKLSVKDLNECLDCDSIPEQQHYRSALLTTVLSHIFMSGQTIREDLLWKFLKKIGFDVDSKQSLHISGEYSGITLKKLLTEVWVRQLYLKYQKMPRSEPTVHEFSWGFRAEKEFNKMDIIKFVCNVYGDDTQPNYWRNQYQIALNQQNSLQSDPNIEIIDDH